MEYKEMIKKIAKICDYHDGKCLSRGGCPLYMTNGGCMAGRSAMELAARPNILDDIDRIVTEWKKPVDWESVSERAKTEDIKVLVWDDDPSNKLTRYLASYDSRFKMFGAFNGGKTRWSSSCYNNDVTLWKHAELVEDDGHE